MASYGIHDGDLMVVDRAITPADQAIVMVVVDGEFVVRQLCYQSDGVTLRTGDDTAPLHVGQELDLAIWGVVRYSIHKT